MLGGDAAGSAEAAPEDGARSDMEREEGGSEPEKGTRGSLATLLAAENSLDEFRDEYDRVHRAMRTSLRTEKMLLAKVRGAATAGRLRAG